jgi:hypothetical protein
MALRSHGPSDPCSVPFKASPRILTSPFELLTEMDAVRVYNKLSCPTPVASHIHSSSHRAYSRAMPAPQPDGGFDLNEAAAPVLEVDLNDPVGEDDAQEDVFDLNDPIFWDANAGGDSIISNSFSVSISFLFVVVADLDVY